LIAVGLTRFVLGIIFLLVLANWLRALAFELARAHTLGRKAAVWMWMVVAGVAVVVVVVVAVAVAVVVERRPF
jgi:hypothetical protein